VNDVSTHITPSTRSLAMWTKPEFTEMRFGFEVTMYIYNR
jgi:pyrroloquinoline quinone biosynthesis protein A